MEKVYETNETGSFCLEKILTKELGDKCALYARVTVPPGVAVPYHRHEGNGESYFFLHGEVSMTTTVSSELSALATRPGRRAAHRTAS